MASIESANSAPVKPSAGEIYRRSAYRRACLLDEDEFRIDGAVLDHGIPCLAFVFEEKLRVNVWSEGLSRLGLQTGPWLREAKRGVRQGAPDDSQISIHGDLSVTLGVLRQHALHTAREQKIAYVVDIAYHDRNIEKVIALARDADQLFIEAPFLDVDANIAAQRQHLTARQAGAIAKRAGVARLVPFHHAELHASWQRAYELGLKFETTIRARQRFGRTGSVRSVKDAALWLPLRLHGTAAIKPNAEVSVLP